VHDKRSTTNARHRAPSGSERAGEPDFDRVRMALACGQPDRIPLAEVGIDDQVRTDYLGRPTSGLGDEVEFWHSAGYDYVLIGRRLGLGLFPGISYGYRYGGKPLPSTGDPRDSSKGWADEGHGAIRTMADFEAYPWPEAATADYSEIDRIAHYLPPGMKAIFYSGPIFQWLWMLMGFETFAFALTDDRELVERLFQRIGEIRLQVLEIALNRCPVLGAVWQLDDIAYSEGLMVSPQILRRWLFPWFRRMQDLCRARDLPLIYHSDGKYWPVLDDLLDIGFCAIHPVEPKGMGADLDELKERTKGRLCLIGGVDLDVLITGTKDGVRSETLRVLRAVGSDGYILGSSNSITADVGLGNYATMLQMGNDYGARDEY